MEKEQNAAVEKVQEEVMGAAPQPAIGERMCECPDCGFKGPLAEFTDTGAEEPDVEVEVEVAPEEVTSTPKTTNTPMTAKDAARKAMDM